MAATKPLCRGCDQPIEGRGPVLPECDKCRRELTYRLAKDNHLSGDEVHRPRATDTGNGLRFANLFWYDVLYVPEANSGSCGTGAFGRKTPRASA